MSGTDEGTDHSILPVLGVCVFTLAACAVGAVVGYALLADALRPPVEDTPMAIAVVSRPQVVTPPPQVHPPEPTPTVTPEATPSPTPTAEPATETTPLRRPKSMSAPQPVITAAPAPTPAATPHHPPSKPKCPLPLPGLDLSCDGDLDPPNPPERDPPQTDAEEQPHGTGGATAPPL